MKWIAFLLSFFSFGCENAVLPRVVFQADSLHTDQWYLSGSNGRESITLSEHTPYKGRGVLIAIVDDGINIWHEDLRDNIGKGNYNYLSDTTFFTNGEHGTSVAGIIAAKEGNGKGISGIAPQSKIIGFNALKTPAIANLADALVREKERVWVSNNSWGDFNSWGEPFALRSSIETALKE